MPKSIIPTFTIEYLKSILNYEPLTGIFTWLVLRSNGLKVGAVAGYLNQSGYIHIGIDRKYYKAHRIAYLYMTGEWPEHEIDHINHDPADNRWENLRAANHQENGRNRKLSKNSTSGTLGVSWHKRVRKWCVQIGSGDTRIHIGYFDTKKEAIEARKAAEIKFQYHENHGKISTNASSVL